MRELRATSTHRRFPNLVLSAATLIAATLLCVAFAAAQELVNVRISVDYRLYGSNAPLWYAQDSGLFRAAGINAIVDASSGSARFDTFHRTRGPWLFVGRIVERECRRHQSTIAAGAMVNGDGAANLLKMLGS